MTLIWVTSLAVPHQTADLSLHSGWYNLFGFGTSSKLPDTQDLLQLSLGKPIHIQVIHTDEFLATLIYLT